MLNKNVINVQSKIESKNDTKIKRLDKISKIGEVPTCLHLRKRSKYSRTTTASGSEVAHFVQHVVKCSEA